MFAKFPFWNFPEASASACRYLVCFLRLPNGNLPALTVVGNPPGELRYFPACRFFTIDVASFVGNVRRTFRGTLCLASVRHAAVLWLVCSRPALRFTRFSLLANGGNQRMAA